MEHHTENTASQHLNQHYLQVLLEMGFLKSVGEKALYLSGNQSIESALE